MIKKILHVKTEEIELTEIPRVMRSRGILVDEAPFKVKATAFNVDECSKIEEQIRSCEPDAVFTYDFVMTVSRACMKADIPYISWVYDCPQSELYSAEAKNPCNYIFLFDQKQVAEAKRIGILNACYVPLAAYKAKLASLLNIEPSFERDVTFVGQLYRNDYLIKLMNEADETVREAYEEYRRGHFLRWGREVGDESASLPVLGEYFGNADAQNIEEKYPYIDEGYYYEAAALSRLLANGERTEVLNVLSKNHDVHLYTFDKTHEGIESAVKIHSGGAKYETELPLVYRNSKININITLHCIEKGACQRVFDVMAAGGFLISNYQEALEELFVPDKEIVLFHNLNELKEKVCYYLEHDKERMDIAQAGQRKVLGLHTLEERVPYMLDFVSKGEEEREKTYTDILLEILTEEGICASQNDFDGFDKYILRLKKREDEALSRSVLLRIAGYYVKINKVSAVKVLIYSEKLLAGDLTLKVYEANLLMELGLFDEALDALLLIRQPTDEILQLIATLQNMHSNGD